MGCGPGVSSHALLEWAEEVFAIDISQSMLDQATKNENIHYQMASAENLPFGESFFDLIFAGSSFHWLERRKFLNEASRVLRSGGKLLIYDSALKNGLRPDFHKKFNEIFPRPYSDVHLSNTEMEFFNFSIKESLVFMSDREFTSEEIFQYLMSLSNITAALERGESLPEIESRVRTLLEQQSSGIPFKFQVYLTEILKK